MRAVCLIRQALHYRREAFCLGLRAAGYDLVDQISRPGPTDVLVIWQRYGPFDEDAKRFESGGARVVVAENGYLGKRWMEDDWFALALGHHNGAGDWNVGAPTRWDELGVGLWDWTVGGTETLILEQRGIGERGVASPPHWAENTKSKLRFGRIRKHPERLQHGDQQSRRKVEIALAVDLKNVKEVVTWSSSAALRALAMGVPVWYEQKKWIGAGAARHISEYGGHPLRDDQKRLDMFRRLIWAMWRLDEIRSGAAFQHLLHPAQRAAA